MSNESTPARRGDRSSQPVRSERTREQILEAALAFLASRPFRDLTVGLLMEDTAVGRSAFYFHFADLYELMEVLLVDLEQQILEQAGPWFVGTGDPVPHLVVSLEGLVRICHERGPLLRAVSDAAATDERLEHTWTELLGRFDDAVEARIRADQEQGLIPPFEARPVAVALNRLDASLLIDAFGSHPRSAPEPVRDAIVRIWTSTLYGSDLPSGSRSRAK